MYGKPEDRYQTVAQLTIRKRRRSKGPTKSPKKVKLANLSLGGASLKQRSHEPL